MPKVRLYGDISPDHEVKFLFIKGALGCKANGEALEKMIDKLTLIVHTDVAKSHGGKRA